MNRIYWDMDKIALLTDHMDATAHSHGMIQFFLCLEGNLQIKAAGEIRVCPCIAVNQNVRHSKRLRIPGTEDMEEAYKNKWFHVKGGIVGTALGLIVALLSGCIVHFVSIL